ITVAQPEPRQTTGPSVTCVYHTYALIATPASPSQTIGITPFQHIHRAAPIPRRQGWPAKARNIRAFAMAIIEVLPRRLREPMEHSLVGMAIAGEEGHAFGVGTMSSRALVGELGRSRLAQLRDGTGRSVDEYLRARAHGLPAARVPAEVDAYVELHIEQGPVL